MRNFKTVMPYYFVAIDGENPCSWEVFGDSLHDVSRRLSDLRMSSSHSNRYDIQVSLLCDNPLTTINDEAIGRTVGCFISSRVDRYGGLNNYVQRFSDFSNRLLELNRFPQKLGFTILIVKEDGSIKTASILAVEFKRKLLEKGYNPLGIRIDGLSNLSDIRLALWFSLADIASNPRAIPTALEASHNGC